MGNAHGLNLGDDEDSRYLCHATPLLDQGKIMETLEIRNFLTIKKAEIVIKRVNIIIGLQATGKSIIAKLIYVFQDFLSRTLPALIRFGNEDSIGSSLTNLFTSIFPKYAWENQDFLISYKINNVFITISPNRTNLEQLLLHINFSGKFDEFVNQAKDIKEQRRNDLMINLPVLGIDTAVQSYICESIFGIKFLRSLFIPAGRSFFTIIQGNIFSLLENNANIDPFTRIFGSHYEHYKSDYDSSASHPVFFSDIQLIPSVKERVKKILAGEYQHYNQEDWIYNHQTEARVKLKDASSGQQESLPMLLIMSTAPFSISPDKLTSFFIEEPEAHLFPSAQKSIIDLFSLLYNRRNCNFFITTHSPYVLTAINVLIKAGNIYNSTDNQAKKERINEIVDKQLHIKFEDVAAYTIKDGILESIVNEDLQIIGSSIIDSVSDEFESEYNALLDLEYE